MKMSLSIFVTGLMLTIPLSSALSYEIKFLEKVTPLQLKEILTKSDKKPLGAGGEAIVWKVEYNNKHFAMRIECSGTTKRLDYKGELTNNRFEQIPGHNFYKKMMESQETNPFQTKIVAQFWLRNKNNANEQFKYRYPCSNIPQNYFLNDYYENPKNEGHETAEDWYHGVTLLELADGDLGSETYQFYKKGLDLPDDDGADRKVLSNERIASENFEMLVSRHLLEKQGITINDNKLSNYLYRNASEEYYLTYCLGDFDYWGFKIGDRNLYLKAQKYVIKRADYDNHNNGEKSKVTVRNGREIFKEYLVLAENNKNGFTYTPPTDARVLDLGIFLD